MSVPASRADLISFCKRRLGDGAVKVNVTPEQCDDAVDYALAKFRDYHFDGTQRAFVSHQITADDKTNRYVVMPDDVLEVVDVFPFTGALLGTGIWNLQYQAIFTSMDMFRSFDTSGWVVMMYNLQTMEELFAGKQPIRFSRYDGKLYVDTDWSQLVEGDYLVADCYLTIDPTQQTKVWSDPWLQQYVTALIKRQWGTNLSKYDGVPLLGGVTFSGQKIKDEAQAEIDKLDAELITNYSVPPTDVVG